MVAIEWFRLEGIYFQPPNLDVWQDFSKCTTASPFSRAQGIITMVENYLIYLYTNNSSEDFLALLSSFLFLGQVSWTKKLNQWILKVFYYTFKVYFVSTSFLFHMKDYNYPWQCSCRCLTKKASQGEYRNFMSSF